MRFSRRQWIEKIGHALGVAAYILVMFLPLATLAGQSAEWLAGGGGATCSRRGGSHGSCRACPSRAARLSPG